MLKDPELSLSDVLQAKAFSQLPNFDRCRRFCRFAWQAAAIRAMAEATASYQFENAT